VQLPNQETQPVLVPLVKDFYVSKESLDSYVKRLAEKAGALTPEEANRQISQARQDLLQLENTEPDSLIDLPDKPAYPTEKTTARNKKGQTIFDKLKKIHSDKDI
jgi:hypothetical protein